MKELGLELNEEKTKIVNTRRGQEGFDFLGFRHRRVRSPKYNKYYTQKWPSNKSRNSIRTKIKEFLGKRSTLPWKIEDVVRKLKPILRGWMNYFRFGNSAKEFAKIDRYVHGRMALWWSKKHQKSGRRWKSDFTWDKFMNCGLGNGKEVDFELLRLNFEGNDLVEYDTYLYPKLQYILMIAIKKEMGI